LIGEKNRNGHFTIKEIGDESLQVVGSVKKDDLSNPFSMDSHGGLQNGFETSYR
jgi:hypothetical protein